MKKTNNIKDTLIKGTFVIMILLIASCDNNRKQDDTKVAAEDRNEAQFDNKDQERDAQFLVDVAEYNQKQIRLGQLAQQKGSSAHIKELGKMMEETHTKSQSDLTALARSKNITIPTSQTNDSRDLYEDLNEKSGNDFDKAYADKMVSMHEDAISDFENAAKDRNDREINNWANSTLPNLRRHLNRSIESKKKTDDL